MLHESDIETNDKVKYTEKLVNLGFIGKQTFHLKIKYYILLLKSPLELPGLQIYPSIFIRKF